MSSLGLFGLYGGMRYMGDWVGLFAGSTIIMVPSFVVYLFLSRNIIRGSQWERPRDDLTGGSASQDEERDESTPYRDLGFFRPGVARERTWIGVPVRAAGASNRARGSRGPGVRSEVEEALHPRVEGSWRRDCFVGHEVSWDVGDGPRTKAWLLVQKMLKVA